jgi:hypothetical protein
MLPESLASNAGTLVASRRASMPIASDSKMKLQHQNPAVYLKTRPANPGRFATSRLQAALDPLGSASVEPRTIPVACLYAQKMSLTGKPYS